MNQRLAATRITLPDLHAGLRGFLFHVRRVIAAGFTRIAVGWAFPALFHVPDADHVGVLLTRIGDGRLVLRLFISARCLDCMASHFFGG